MSWALALSIASEDRKGTPHSEISKKFRVPEGDIPFIIHAVRNGRAVNLHFTDDHDHQWQRGEMVQVIQRFWEMYDRAPSRGDWRRSTAHYPSYRQVEEEFGSMLNLVEEAIVPHIPEVRDLLDIFETVYYSGRNPEAVSKEQKIPMSAIRDGYAAAGASHLL